jgi:hypothetical protein
MNDRGKFPLDLSWRILGLALYYFAIIIAVILLHARGGLETPPFIYQGF